MHPPQQAGAAVAVGDPAPPNPAKKSKRKRAEKSSGHRDPPPPPSSSSSSRPGERSEEERLDYDEPVDTGSRGGILLREGPGRILPPLAADAWQLLPPNNMAQYRGAVLSPKDLVSLGNEP